MRVFKLISEAIDLIRRRGKPSCSVKTGLSLVDSSPADLNQGK
jgi:hypothetical protein